MPNADKPGGHFIISQLQLDLATVVARLEQLTDETPESQMFDFVLGRVLHCDLPRLRAHLEPELAVLVAEVRENFQGPSRG